MKAIPHTSIDGVIHKECSTCNLNKPLSDFGNSSISKDKLAYSCKPCSRSSVNDMWKDGRTDKLRKTKRTVKAARDNKVLFVQYKGDVCEHCGIKHIPYENSAIFQFHHKDEKEKKFTISSKLSGCFESIKSELDKCQLLCANCHAIHHYKEWKINGKTKK